ncbi:MAG: DUF4129 domain-containing protein [Chloroflexota bacterium]
MSRADLVYPIAVGLAEGGWVAVLYLLVGAVARVEPGLMLGTFFVAAGGTCLLADRLDRLGSSRLTVIVGLLVGGAVAGLILAGGAGAVVDTSDPSAILTADPGAALVGLAALRGFIRAGSIRDPGEAARPFFLGLVGLAAAWIFGGALAEPLRSAFRGAAVVPTLAFLAGGLAATGLARSELAASGTEFDPRANRTWLVVLIGTAVVVGIAALPMGAGLERVMAAFIAWPLSLPLLVVAAVVVRLVVPRRGSLKRVGAQAVWPLVVLGILSLLAAVLPRRQLAPSEDPSTGVGGPATEPTTPVFDLVLALVAVAIAVAVLLFLARAWQRTADPTGRSALLERRGHVAGDDDSDATPGWDLRRRLRALARRGRPTDAVAAYLATLRALEPYEELRRAEDETPAAHARRLHDAGAGSLELDLLAADFQLARWAGRRISSAEDRRAIGRWDRFRGRLADRASRR